MGTRLPSWGKISHLVGDPDYFFPENETRGKKKTPLEDEVILRVLQLYVQGATNKKMVEELCFPSVAIPRRVISEYKMGVYDELIEERGEDYGVEEF